MREFIRIVESAGELRLIEGPWIDDRMVPRLPDGSPPQTLYRIMSRAEYQDGERRGAFMSRDGRVHADIRPHFEYAEPGAENVLVMIDYRDEDGWKAKQSGLGVVAITEAPIPASRVHVVASGTRFDLERAMGREITESVLLERNIPPTDWGYWITDQGEYLPVKSHSHADTARDYLVSRNSDLKNHRIESETAVDQGWIWVKATPGDFFIVLMKRGGPSRRAISALSRLARSADYFEYWLHFENEGGKQDFVDAGEFLRAVAAGNRLDENLLSEGAMYGSTSFWFNPETKETIPCGDHGDEVAHHPETFGIDQRIVWQMHEAIYDDEETDERDYVDPEKAPAELHVSKNNYLYGNDAWEQLAMNRGWVRVGGAARGLSCYVSAATPEAIWAGLSYVAKAGLVGDKAEIELCPADGSQGNFVILQGADLNRFIKFGPKKAAAAFASA